MANRRDAREPSAKPAHESSASANAAQAKTGSAQMSRTSRTTSPNAASALSARGRTWTALAVLTAALSIGAAFAWRAQSAAEASSEAESSQVADLVAACERTGAWHKRALALRSLSEIDSDAAREALLALADAMDDSLAAQAVATLGRMDTASAKSKLEAVVADDARSDFVRSMAVTAWMRAAKRDEVSRSTAGSKFDDARRANTALDDAAKAATAKLWGKE